MIQRPMLPERPTTRPTPITQAPATTAEGSRPRPHVVPSAPVDTAPAENTPRESEAQQAPRAASEESGQNRSWDRAHPAARAHERREANGESHAPAATATANSDTQTSRVNPDHPAATSSQQQVAPPPTPAAAPTPRRMNHPSGRNCSSVRPRTTTRTESTPRRAIPDGLLPG